MLVDDHAVVRDGLRVLLEAQGDIEVVGDAVNGFGALRQAKRLHPDVVIMDIAMPELNGIEATKQLRDACPLTQTVILSMHSTTEHIFRALQAGARGYLLKDCAGSEVVDAVRAVYAGQRYLSNRIAATVVDDYIAERHPKSPLESLSHRERQILQLVVEGKSSSQIAVVLFLS
ncbi:MAG: response regulator, partial [Casimicrobiaceae bacterium]